MIRRPVRRRDWTAELMRQCATLRLPTPEREYRFHPSRRWRFDLAFPDHKIAVEIEGGVFLPFQGKHAGRHTHPAGFRADCEKYAHATVLGWRVLRILPEWIPKSIAVSFLYDLLTTEQNRSLHVDRTT